MLVGFSKTKFTATRLYWSFVQQIYLNSSSFCSFLRYTLEEEFMLEINIIPVQLISKESVYTKQYTTTEQYNNLSCIAFMLVNCVQYYHHFLPVVTRHCLAGSDGVTVLKYAEKVL